MLILTRKTGETITITNTESNEVIEIAYLGNNSPTQAKIGISAPRHMNIVRTEIMNRDKLDKDENWGNR